MRLQIPALLLLCLITSAVSAQDAVEREAKGIPQHDPHLWGIHDEASLAYGRPGAGLSVKGGYLSSLGDGFYEQRVEDGWSIECNFRQSIGPCWYTRPVSLFVEYGGSYTRFSGDLFPVVTSGAFNLQGVNAAGLPVGVPSTGRLDNLLNTSLEHLTYGGAQAAIGAILYPHPEHRKVHFTCLAGVRWGWAGTGFIETPTPELQQEIDTVLMMPGVTDVQSSLVSDVRRNDAYFGLYANVGAAMNFSEFLHLGVQVGFDQLWIDLGDFNTNDNSLGTVSALGTITALF